MRGFDVNRFVRSRTPVWESLEASLLEVERQGIRRLDLDQARRLGQLYRAVSSDLVRARTEMVDATVVDYLNALVARAYAQIYAGAGRSGKGLTWQKVWYFYSGGFPRLVRHEWKAIVLSAGILLFGSGLGATFTAVDPASLSVLIPDQHQAHTPEERVADEETSGGIQDPNASAAFSSFLFTHNIKVTFLVFALGITFGVGTVIVLFYNGVPLGALAMQYHLAGHGLFFWAWILPHGIPELTVVFIAGGAGLILARGLWMPGQRSRGDALLKEAKTAAQLIVGGMPLLVLAGLIEGTISQMHAPAVPYWLKLLVAAMVGVAVYAYLLFAGRANSETASPY
ncbi:MAG: stage II sporulation protein M [Myxococcota bacterium]